MAFAHINSSFFVFNDAQVTKETGVAFIECPPYRQRHKHNDKEIIKEDHWHGTRYTGTVKARLLVGLIEDHMLPGRPGRNKTSVTLTPSFWKADFIDRVRINKRTDNVFIVYVAFSKEESHRRWELVRAEMENMRQKEQAEKFKASAIQSLSFGLRLARDSLIAEDGYGFDDETLCAFEQAAEEFMDVLKNGEIMLASQDVATESAPTKSPKPQSDLQLQRFLKNITSDLSLVQNEKPEGL
ncbi:Hypothetical protein HEAR3026 [Herminiimonas arsenicoxydans]|uniref:Uncharacterized protein n=1 Tax=Herminiimonas arsenicoxydans TaxID=204773 RepID=A4G9E8_HERAR|nr:Hypothetical protein HEAR3026 [Herminiimonas arsenicoxydans]